MIATLVKGGCLLLASKEKLKTSLGETIDFMKADALGITPSALSLLSPSQVPGLKQITLVGEQVAPGLLETWCEHVAARNTSGLSECTQLNFGRPLTIKSNPRVVGRPSDTTSAYVLKPVLTVLAPIGTTGELCLAGPQLGRGYLKKVEQTAKVFIDNPFGEGSYIVPEVQPASIMMELLRSLDVLTFRSSLTDSVSSQVKSTRHC